MNILITGASAGYGAAAACQFVKAGHRVIAIGRRKSRLMELANQLGHENILPLPLDVTNRNDVIKTLTQLPPNFVNIDVLINSAGLALGLEKAPKASLDDWDKMIDTNIKGLTYVTLTILPGMISRQKGHIINLGSVAGRWPYPGSNVYGATKAFVRQFSLNLRADLLGTPIRVTDIEPGLSGGTEFSLVRFKGDQSKVNATYDGTNPLNAQDVAETIFWVATRPSHVNINTVEMMPVCQAFSPLAVHKEDDTTC